MSYPSNQVRADWAYSAVSFFAGTTGLDMEEEAETAITDLLANLMHLCRLEKIDFNRCLATGQMHFKAEIEEEA